MSRIVITTIGSLGDLHPYIAIGLGLRDRGHTVEFVTAKDYRAKIEALGFPFHALRPDHITLDDHQMIALMMDRQKGSERVIRDYLLANLRDTYTDLIAATHRADLIVAHEIVYAAALVAEIRHIPWVSCVLAPIAFFSANDPPVLPPFPALAKLRVLGPRVNRLVIDFAKFVTRHWAAPVRQLRRELGLAAIGNLIIDDKFSPDLVLALFSPVLGARQPDWPPQTVITGFPVYDGHLAPAPELTRFLTAGEAPLVFTLGSTAVLAAGNFYAESIAAAQALDRRAVLLIGSNPVPKNLPPSIMACNYAPYSTIFPQARAIVHQGGVGTTAQALRAGHPTLVMPYSHDQPDNAARLERLGTSRSIPRQHYSAARVVKELKQLFNHASYTTRALEIKQILQLENGVNVACNAIENQLSNT
jgi:rhamnosyltransferase subunit B